MADEQTNPDETRAAVEESRRELESLTYIIAHDLRAPLRTIDGFTRALSEDCGEKLDEEGRRCLKHALEATRHISEMLEGLLALARISRAEFHPARVELGSSSTDPPVYFVRDIGAGFDMRHAAKLFGPFQRLHSEREFEGVGIGLATAQRIIRRHGGQLWADAALDKGATLYFTLNETAGN